MKNIYINSQGGLGFNLALSHIVKEFKQIYDKGILYPNSCLLLIGDNNE